MGIWLFGRKGKRKISDSGESGPRQDATTHETSPQRDQEEMNSAAMGNATTGGRLERRKSRPQKKLQRNPEKRTYSFSPGRNDSIRVPKDIHRRHPVPAIPKAAVLAELQPTSRANLSQVGAQPNVESQDGVQDRQRAPTLHKRSAQDASRRISNKKRKDDHDREAEIRAMSEQLPIRVATSPDLSGRPLREDTKRMRGINKIFGNRQSDISLPMRESLHSSLSVHSKPLNSYQFKGIDLFTPHPTIRYTQNPRYAPGASGIAGDAPDSEGRKFLKLIPFPAGTIKPHKRIDDIADDLDASDLRELLERDQRRRERKKLSDRRKMERKIAKKTEKQRAAELEAARNGSPPPKNMDRGVLGREVRGLSIDTGVGTPIKRWASDASSRRRGKRPAHVTGEDSTTSMMPPSGGFPRRDSLAPSITPVDDLEDPIIGTAQVARLSRASMSPPVPSNGHSRDVSSISQMIDPRNNTDVVLGQATQLEQVGRPEEGQLEQIGQLEQVGRPEEGQLEQIGQLEQEGPLQQEEPLEQTRQLEQAGQLEQARHEDQVGLPKQEVQPMQSKRQRAPPQVQRELPAQPERSRSSSDTSSRLGQSWTSFFKRISKTRRQSSIPSTFSNLSRNSAAYDQPITVTGDLLHGSISSAPKRTMSKFREDLPEFPLSPPDSRVHSPEGEADIVLPIQSPHSEKEIERHSLDHSAEFSSRRHDTPTSGYRSIDPASRFRNETPTSGRRSNEIPSPDPPHALTHNLASIDSEGSWLSGRSRAGSKRGSALLPSGYPLQDGTSFLKTRPKEFSESTEELGIAEDEYFSRLHPGSDDGFDKLKHRRVSGNPMPSSDDEEGSSMASPTKAHKMKWGAVRRHASVVHREEPRAKSRQGMLNDDSDSLDDTHEETFSDLYGNGEIDEGEEESGLRRATSVEYKKAHVKHISAGSAKLLGLEESKRLSSG